ncbi:MAG: redox-sensing transcriptional repressor Rex, partial [Ruminococcus sp.]|nr:redox-sensing transcriptional repressor Rex [Candidatus Copronaster equi]
MSRKQYISPAIIHRLPRYYRYLNILQNEGIKKISSKDLAEKMGLTSSQIRQDLNSFGEFGQQGYGYDIDALKAEIASIIGLDQHFKAVIVGIGNLGTSVANYMDRAENGFELVGFFDKDPLLIGTTLLGQKVH